MASQPTRLARVGEHDNIIHAWGRATGVCVAVCVQDSNVPAGRPFQVRMKTARLAKLTEAVSVGLREGPGTAAVASLTGKKEDAVLMVTPAPGTAGRHAFTFRASALQEGKYPVISETTVWVEFTPAAKGR